MEQYIFPAVGALIVGVLLWLLQRERLVLEYEIVESDPFPLEGGIGKYFVCELKNNGNRAIEKISLKIEAREGRILSIKYSNTQLLNIDEQNGSLVEGIVPLLNPKEQISAILTLKGVDVYANVRIQARAVGVTAKKKSSESIPLYYKIIVAIALTSFGSFLAYNAGSLMAIKESINDINVHSKFLQEAEGKPDQPQIVFATLNRAGLSQILPGLIDISGDTIPYWKTGVYLMHSYLLDKGNAKKYVNALEQLSQAQDIAPSSKGFLLYFAGRIEKSEGHLENAAQYFGICKKEAPLMYEYLMAQDPNYDLEAVKAWLIKNK